MKVYLNYFIRNLSADKNVWKNKDETNKNNQNVEKKIFLSAKHLRKVHSLKSDWL